VDPNPPDAIDSRTPLILAISGVAFTLVVVVALIAVVLLATDKDTGDLNAPRVFLLAANAPVADPFTRSILVTPVTMSDQASAKASALLRQIPIRADRGARLVAGRQPELYGVTGERHACDVVTLANQLDSDTSVAQIWGLSLGLTTGQIPHYLNTLTPVVLMDDTWVSTYELTRGSNAPRQAILQAGTAVLIDPLGVPRVHCVSGGPLTPPANDDLAQYRPGGEEWAGFSTQTVLAVAYGGTVAIGDFAVIDVTTGQQLARTVGGTIDLGGATVPLPDPAVMNVPLGAR
jgi:hypothetical protein